MNRIIGLIKSLYLVAANTLMFLFFIILTAHLILILRNNFNLKKDFYSYLSIEQKSAYSHLSKQQVNDLLRNTWAVDGGGWEYERWLGFREVERKSNLVNVNEFGIRANSRNQIKMRDINNAIWMFGGSTTFGYGVSDSETIPALLEANLNKHVINFGRGYFYSAQENLLLRQLLKAGYNPEEVFFLDGINEACDINTYQEELKQLFAKAQYVYGWTIADLATPLIFLVEKIKLKFFGLKKKYDNFECSLYGNKQPLSDILRKNMLERKNLCEQYALKCTTFVQPFAGVHGIHKDYISWPHDSRDQFKNKFNLLKNTFESCRSIFITDALDGYPDHAFVDGVHYSLDANRRIADLIIMKMTQNK